ncbi:MAG TPA: ATP-grasp domain-containing protein [Pyrinomonadaceae bacterium]
MNTSLRILWLESGDLYTIRRGVEAGRRLGVRVDSLEVLDLTFSADGVAPHLAKGAEELAATYDAVIMRSFMPFVSEALTVARLFRDAGKVVVDTSLTDEGYAMSKMHDYVLLSRAGVAVPRTYQCADPAQAERHAEALGFPCVLKAVFGSEGRNVFKADSLAQFRKILWRRKSGEFMVQEFLPAEVDYRVITVGYKALPVMVRRKPQPGEFRTNFDFKEEVTSVPTDEHPDMKELAERAARTLRREFSGVDIRYRGEEPTVLEANRRPGFKGFEEATGFDVAGAFIEYVRDRCLAARTA